MNVPFNSARFSVVPTWLAGAVLAAALLPYAPPAAAQFTDPTQTIGVRPELLQQVGIDQKLDNQVPLDLTFRDEHGSPVELGQACAGKPVVLTLVYYNCPMLCTQVLNALDRSLESMPLEIGKDFNVVTVSIDPTDRAPIADASAILVLTPDGKVSKYFYGVTYPARDLRLGLVDASQEKIGTVADQVLLFCYHYDPHTGKYGLLISRVMQLGGLATVVIGGIFLIILFRGEHYELPRKVGPQSLGKSRA